MASFAKTVVIVGASRGLGLELVRQVAETSPKVLIAGCRNPSEASELQAIAEKNKFIKIVKLDVENDADIDEAVKETQSLVGDAGLNLLFTNAGLYLNKADGGEIRVQTRERMQRHFNVNTTSPIILTKKFLPLLELAAKQGGSSLSCTKAASVVMASIMGSQKISHAVVDGTNSLDYKCSKSAVNMAVILMSQQLRESGILVMGVHPGWVKTDMGGEQGQLTPTASVMGILQVLRKAGLKENGCMVSYDGQLLPF